MCCVVQDPPSFLLLGELVEEQLSKLVVRMPEQPDESSLSLSSLQSTAAREPSPDVSDTHTHNNNNNNSLVISNHTHNNNNNNNNTSLP